MRLVYHIVPRRAWEAAPPGPYRADSLAAEGFIHCSNRDQVERVANLFYAAADDLLVLALDAGQLGDALRDEDVGTGERFPHVYGPIDRGAIVEVLPLARGPGGGWRLPRGGAGRG